MQATFFRLALAHIPCQPQRALRVTEGDALKPAAPLPGIPRPAQRAAQLAKRTLFPLRADRGDAGARMYW